MVNATRHGAWRRGADRLEQAEADLTLGLKPLWTVPTTL